MQKQLLQDINFSDSNESLKYLTLCCNSLVSINNKEITIYKTTILHSKGVGILGLGNRKLNISKCLMAYNQINCIIFVVKSFAENSLFSISESHSVWTSENMFVYLRESENTFNISLTNVTLTDNRAPCGNFYMNIGIQSAKPIHVNIYILDTCNQVKQQ